MVRAHDGDNAIPQLFTVGANFTDLRPAKPSFDFAIGTAPRVLAEGVLALGLRPGLAIPLEVSSTLIILPSAGLSLFGIAGADDGAFFPGANVGIAAVLLGQNSSGLRP